MKNLENNDVARAEALQSVNALFGNPKPKLSTRKRVYKYWLIVIGMILNILPVLVAIIAIVPMVKARLRYQNSLPIRRSHTLFMRSLESSGIVIPDDIDVVLMKHLHPGVTAAAAQARMVNGRKTIEVFDAFFTQPIAKMADLIRHESVHLDQMARGDLYFDFESSKTNPMITWKGCTKSTAEWYGVNSMYSTTICAVIYNQYFSFKGMLLSPWEREAYLTENTVGLIRTHIKLTVMMVMALPKLFMGLAMNIR